VIKEATYDSQTDNLS